MLDHLLDPLGNEAASRTAVVRLTHRTEAAFKHREIHWPHAGVWTFGFWRDRAALGTTPAEAELAKGQGAGKAESVTHHWARATSVTGRLRVLMCR